MSEQTKEVQINCIANGCTCPNVFEGKCEWHAMLENAEHWPRMTELLQHPRTKRIRWYINALMVWSIDVRGEATGGNKLYDTDLLSYHLEEELFANRFPPDVASRYKDETPRGYAVRIKRELAKRLINACQGRGSEKKDWREIGARNAEKALAIIAGRGAELMKEAV